MQNGTQQWLDRIGAGISPRDLARVAGVSHATLYRQINADQLTFDVVLAIARGYGVSPVSALVANGYLTADEAGISTGVAALHGASDQELVEEVARRIGASGTAETAFDVPVGAALSEGGPSVEPVDFIGVSTDERGAKSAYGKAASRGTLRADEPHAE